MSLASFADMTNVSGLAALAPDRPPAVAPNCMFDEMEGGFTISYNRFTGEGQRRDLFLEVWSVLMPCVESWHATTALCAWPWHDRDPRVRLFKRVRPVTEGGWEQQITLLQG